ncbi:MAG: PAS domain S-box protein [Bacteroidota bacterium]
MKQLDHGYQLFIESTLDAVIIIDNNGKITEWNSNAHSIFLWTKEEAVNRYIHDLIIPERFIKAHKAGIKTFFETGKGPILKKRIEIVGIDKNNREFPIELAVWPLNINNTIFFSAFIRDISERKRLYNFLEEEKNLFSQILSSITEPIFYKSTSHIYLRCNQAFAELHSKTAEEIIGKSDEELYGKEKALKFIESDLFVINQKKEVVSEEWFLCKSGRSKFFNTIKQPSFDENGEILGIVGICRDLSEIKKIESKHRHLNIEMQKVIEKLKENEKYLTGINQFANTILKQNTIDEIVWEVTENLIKELGVFDCVIYLFDDQKKYLIQRAAYGPKQVGTKEIMNPIMIPTGKGIVGAVAKTGKSELIADTSLDERYIVDDAIRLSEITVPIIANGEVIGVIDSEHPDRNYFSQSHLDKLQTVANLISSRMKGAINQEKLLIAQKNILKLSIAVEQSTLSIVITDANGIIEFVNPAFEKLTGYSTKEAIGRKTSLLKSGEQSDSFYNQLWSTILKGERWTGEVINKKKNGDIFWIISAISPIVDKNGVVTNFVAFQTDITQFKKLENELISAKLKAEAADKSKSQFLANMSHEIRTPLNGIIGMIKQFGKDQLSNQQQHNADNAMKASQHLLSIINNILDISKIEAGEFNITTKHFSVSTLLGDILSILSTQAQQKKLELKININKNTSEIFFGDESIIRQILINIVGNAIKFTTKGGVTLDCYSSNKPFEVKSNNNISSSNQESNQLQDDTDSLQLNFIIEDTGIGMDRIFLHNLFEKFKQEDASIGNKYGGTGLGLYITKKMIDLLNGSIKVRSEKGVGTQIHICLPITVGDIQEVEHKELLIDDQQLKNAKILLVEDNEMNRLVACNALEQFNVVVTEAENGFEAVELMKNSSFDIVLMDIQMPVMNGIEATRIIRNKLKINTPIIGLSANAFKTEIEACMSIGMNEFITKPFEDNDLFQVIVKHYKKPVDPNLDQHIAGTTLNISTDKLYDLSKLKQMSKGNDVFVNKMLTLLINNFPIYIEEFRNSFDNGDIESLQKIVHKLKPSLANLSITSIKQDIQDIESFDVKINSLEQLRLLVENVTNLLEEVVAQVKKSQTE